MKCLIVLQKSFDLNRASQSDFWRSEWNRSHVSAKVGREYFVFRTIYMLTFVGLLVYDLVQYEDLSLFLIYFTNWTLVLQTLYSLIYFFRLMWLENICKETKLIPLIILNDEDDTPIPQRLPFPEKLIWILYNIVGTWPYVVTIGYWGLVFKPAFANDISSMIIHGTTGPLALIDAAIVAIPIRRIHLFFPWALTTLYILFTCIYEAGHGQYSLRANSTERHEAIYPFLNWKKHPKVAGSMGVGGIIFSTVSHTIFCWGLYRFRLLVKRHCFKQFDPNLTTKPPDITLSPTASEMSIDTIDDSVAGMHSDISFATMTSHIFVPSELSFHPSVDDHSITSVTSPTAKKKTTSSKPTTASNNKPTRRNAYVPKRIKTNINE